MPHPTPPDSPEAPAPAKAVDRSAGAANLFEMVEKVVKLSAVLGAFGYMSLRAHLNYLGVSSTSSLGLERYLMETYNFAATTFVEVVVLIAIALLIFLLLNFIGRLVLRNERAAGAAQRLCAWGRRMRGKPFLPGALLLATLGYYFWLLATLSRHGAHADVAVGRLVPEQLQQGDLSWLFYRTCIVCVVGYLVYSYFSRTNSVAAESASGVIASGPSRTPAALVQGRLTRFVWVSFLLAIVVLALQLPLLYGRLVRSPVYPLVRVVAGNGNASPVCGLLVLETSSELSLWRAENGIGTVVLLPRSSLNLANTAQTLNLLTLARAAAENPTLAKPDCERYHDKPDS